MLNQGKYHIFDMLMSEPDFTQNLMLSFSKAGVTKITFLKNLQEWIVIKECFMSDSHFEHFQEIAYRYFCALFDHEVGIVANWLMKQKVSPVNPFISEDFSGLKLAKKFILLHHPYGLNYLQEAMPNCKDELFRVSKEQVEEILILFQKNISLWIKKIKQCEHAKLIKTLILPNIDSFYDPFMNYLDSDDYLVEDIAHPFLGFLLPILNKDDQIKLFFKEDCLKKRLCDLRLDWLKNIQEELLPLINPFGSFRDFSPDFERTISRSKLNIDQKSIILKHPRFKIKRN